MKHKLYYIVLGFAVCLIALTAIAATFKVQVVANSSGQVFFNQAVICSNSLCIRTNLILLDTGLAGGSHRLTITNGSVAVVTNTSNIGL